MLSGRKSAHGRDPDRVGGGKPDGRFAPMV